MRNKEGLKIEGGARSGMRICPRDGLPTRGHLGFDKRNQSSRLLFPEQLVSIKIKHNFFCAERCNPEIT